MLWKKSPQYANMPHEQYMQTDEGKRAQGAFQQWEQWQMGNAPTPSKPGPGRPSVPMMQAYSPGKTGQQGSGGGVTNRYDGSGWASDGSRIKPGGAGSAQPKYSPYANSTPYGQQTQTPQGGAAKPPSLTQYMSPGSPLPGRFSGPRPQEANEAGFQYPTYQQPLVNRYGPGTSPEYMASNPDTSYFNPTANRPPPMYGIYAPGSTAEDINRAGPDALPSPSQPAANRPPPFQATTQNFDGTQSQMPNFQQRDAFISQINNQLGQMQQQSWQQPGMGAPQFNFPQMWGQAGEMAQQGFQNPFAQRPDGGDQIRQLLGGQQGRMMSQDAWGQMYPGMQYPSSPGGLPAEAFARGAQGDIVPSAVGRPLPGLPPGAIADGPPPAQSGGGVNRDSAPRGSRLPAFNRPILLAPGSPGDPSPPITPGTAQPIPPQEAPPRAEDADALFQKRYELTRQAGVLSQSGLPPDELATRRAELAYQMQETDKAMRSHPAYQARLKEDREVMSALQEQGFGVTDTSLGIAGAPQTAIDNARRMVRDRKPAATAPQHKPPGRRMNLNPYTNADAPPGRRFNVQAFEDMRRSLLDAAAAAGRAGNQQESAKLRARADDLLARRESFRAEAEDDVERYNRAVADYGAAARRKDMQLNPQRYQSQSGGSGTGGFGYAAAAREYEAGRRAGIAANNKIPVAQRNKLYGSDANRRIAEMMM